MLSIAIRLTDILTRLRIAIGVFADDQARARQAVWLGDQAYLSAVGPVQKLPPETWTLIGHRLGRLAARFQSLFARWRANTLPPPRPGRAARPHRPPPLRLPRTYGWINHRVPGSALCAGALGPLLLDPETRSFVLAAPRAGRLLRPLCRALGVALPDWLTRPPRSKPPRPPRPAQFGPPPPPDRPLPRYVRAAMRAWKRKSG